MIAQVVILTFIFGLILGGVLGYMLGYIHASEAAVAKRDP